MSKSDKYVRIKSTLPYPCYFIKILLSCWGTSGLTVYILEGTTFHLLLHIKYPWAYEIYFLIIGKNPIPLGIYICYKESSMMLQNYRICNSSLLFPDVIQHPALLFSFIHFNQITSHSCPIVTLFQSELLFTKVLQHSGLIVSQNYIFLVCKLSHIRRGNYPYKGHVHHCPVTCIYNCHCKLSCSTFAGEKIQSRLRGCICVYNKKLELILKLYSSLQMWLVLFIHFNQIIPHPSKCHPISVWVSFSEDPSIQDHNNVIS
jgi:hypothetical protein